MAVGIAAYFLGRHLERSRWWPLHFVATLSAQPSVSIAEKPADAHESIEHLAQRLSETVRELRQHWETTRDEMDNLRQALDGLDVGVILLDRAGRVTLANQPAIDLWGPLSPHLAGRYAIELFQRAVIDQALSDARRDGRARVVDYVPGNSPHVYEVAIRPLNPEHHKDEQPFLLVGVRDVTELRAVERMRRDFVANASHELRTPLTAIQGYADTLLEEGLDEAKRTRYLHRMVANTEFMAHILDDMLKLARVESFETPFSHEPLDLAAEVRLGVERTRALFEEKRLQLQSNLQPATIPGDSDQIQQVISNLLSNSARYTPTGGMVWISTDVTHREGRLWGRLIVEDNGIGIPAADRTLVFQRFYRVDNGRSRDVGGTGLGLAIVKHILMRHDGRVWVEGREGSGSRFICLFPASHEPNDHA